MTKTALASILVKVLGLSLSVTGIVHLINGIFNMLFLSSRFIQGSYHPDIFWQMLSNYGVYGALYIGIGVFLIIRTPRIVEGILGINAGE